jgi:Tfp pilus assembly protein PilO
MPAITNRTKRVRLVALTVTLLCVVVSLVAWSLSSRHMRHIRELRHEAALLQQRLISAQITTSRLDEVKKLIAKNLAFSRSDTLVQSASMPFLKALTMELDELGIALHSLEPQQPFDDGRFTRTPYSLSVQCTYDQFCQLVNKLEKSSRLIALEEFTIENSIDDFFNRGMKGGSSVRLRLTTVTLVRN